ncbi:hypothetical protein GCM10022222_60650 [Amycolatopsis ultiminotia]|uniref:Uncharacterized protein n=1 Tax=Amycolatopsis ultiminotia TaxID=543629 RepID=A0ABP6XM08_9PSEU
MAPGGVAADRSRRGYAVFMASGECGHTTFSGSVYGRTPPDATATAAQFRRVRLTAD